MFTSVCAQVYRLTCLSPSGFAGTSIWTCILERKYPQASTKQFFAGGLSRFAGKPKPIYIPKHDKFCKSPFDG
jgi:hypothetical protein